MDRKKIERFAAIRAAEIERATAALADAARELAAYIFDEFFAEMAARAEKGRVGGTAASVNRSPAWRAYYERAEGVARLVVGRMGQVADTVKGYYAALLGRPRSDFDRVAEEYLHSLGFDGVRITPGGYLHGLTNDTTAERRVKAYAIQAIRAGKTLTQFRAELSAIMKGDRAAGRMGVVEAHYHTNASTAFSEFERAMSNDVAVRNGLHHALWSGPRLADTRAFCAARKGKVFTREEIVAMDGQKWAGKIPGQSTLISQGGYGCVDSLLWITREQYDEFKRLGR